MVPKEPMCAFRSPRERGNLGGGAVSGQVQSRPIGISSASQKYSVGGSSDSACASTVQQLSVRCNIGLPEIYCHIYRVHDRLGPIVTEANRPASV